MLQITPIPAFQDNYFWVIDDSRSCIVVDPGAAPPVLDFIAQTGLQLAAIFITHHHADHTGGLPELLQKYPYIAVYGPDNTAIVDINHTVSEGDSLSLLGTGFHVLAVPGHTLDHIAFYAEQEAALFCGDTLFVAGCGRIFEGTAAMMFKSLERLAALPATTQVYCAHEYTLANLRFALEVEPENQAIHDRLLYCQQLRQDKRCTLPALLGEELKTNPFLRTREDTVITQALNQGARSTAPVDIFSCLREWKNHF